MRTAFLVIGIIATLLGLVWIGQGTGYFPYPKRELHDQPDVVGLSGHRAGSRRSGPDLVFAAVTVLYDGGFTLRRNLP
jgi:hypothetical protein